MINYWGEMDKDLEIQQGKSIAEAAQVSAINHSFYPN